ncbi:MAG: hypothetical protein HKN92_11380 [Chitinophagales bacterium]|nr:hypothetical protein [Chitinophagales bacterium]
MNRLNQLVDSLSRTEKGYFRKYCKVYSNGKLHKYLKVFDAIDKAPPDSGDDYIKKKFEKETFSNNYPVTKKYLFEQILKSLELYNSGKSIHKKIEWLINKAELLYSKSLINECLQSLKRARKLAYQTDEFPYILQIISFEKKIGGAHRYKGIYKRFKTLLDEEMDVLDKMKNYSEIQLIYYKVFETIKKDRSLRTKRDLKLLNKMVQTPILSDISSAKTVRAKITFCSTWTFYYDLAGEYDEAYEYAKKLVGIWEDNPVHINEYPDRYLAANQNFLNRCYRLKRYEEFPAVLDKLKLIKPTSKEMEVTYFEMMSHFEMLYVNQTRNERRARALFKEIEQGLENYKTRIKTNYRNLFCYNICVELMSLGEYDEALSWANKIIQKQKLDIQQDLMWFLRLLYLLIHLELGNKTIIEYELRSINRYLESEKRGHKFESIFLEFIKEATEQLHIGHPRKLYRKYAEKIQLLKADKFEKNVFDYFSFDSFLLAKAHGLSLREYEEKYEDHAS